MRFKNSLDEEAIAFAMVTWSCAGCEVLSVGKAFSKLSLVAAPKLGRSEFQNQILLLLAWHLLLLASCYY